MMSITVEDGRKPPAGTVLTDEERVRLFNSIVSAYSGRYTVEGNKVIHAVDVSWNEAWTGTQQVRYFEVDGRRADDRDHAAHDRRRRREVINTLVWDRVEALPAVEQPPR